MQMQEAEPSFDLERPADNRKKGGNFVVFYNRPKQQMEESKAQGRPIFKMVEYVKITIPGERDEVDKPVSDRERERYRKEYEAFLSNKSDEPTGTPLSAWGGIPPERIEEYAYRRVRTVEQLAEISDGTLQKFGPGTLKERERARDYVKVAQGQAPVMQLRSELEAETEMRKGLELKLEAMQAALNELQGQKGVEAAPKPEGKLPKRKAETQ